ncbi:MAG TPA: hypothetical protein VFQ95_04015 [Rhodanobacteraceae bacterium]|nr:hypothetical protein [Rhodanobacteraceae bacterium]
MISEAYRQSRAFLGSTPEEVQAGFAATIERHFARPGAAAVFARLSDKELSDLAALYKSSAPVGDVDLYRTLASRLDANQLIRAAVAFGAAPVEAAVRSVASATVEGAFTAELALDAQAAQSTGAVGVSGIHTMTPNVGMTLREIYLDFRTDPVGSLGVRDALAETGFYVGSELVGAATVGYALGQGLNYLIENYAPGLDQAIGGTEYNMVQDMQSAATEFEQGRYEKSIDALFGSPLANAGDYAGDDDVGGSYAFYEDDLSGSGC